MTNIHDFPVVYSVEPQVMCSLAMALGGLNHHSGLEEAHFRTFLWLCTPLNDHM